ncbi:MAG: hypothetical protein PHH52_02305 [Patescibacteria group bacterium]|jgi:hypothetical protein|nr:hypothetical protein [Patescibacteria group bacterium]MDD3778191.1 hypothetical protein [Patescibacteria group bacterium]MDD3939840.1 hypothetical protein [Patescibacteria group bacterium]MDD4444150.1 hypothetical protein [Patescibacteria group bacterium]NCU39942.1 hypothetical protein [Candidatus Falkowbacteria bacterium]
MKDNNSLYIKWQVPEYRIPDRSKTWYRAAFVLVIALLFTCFFTLENWRPVFLGYQSNFLFAFIIILSSIIMIMTENKPPQIIDVKIGPEGVEIGEKFYDYDRFRHFSVIYKPKQSIKNLYIEFKNPITPRLSLPLRSLDPLSVRNFLLKYLDEDLERTEPPLSEQLTSKLKL